MPVKLYGYAGSRNTTRRSYVPPAQLPCSGFCADGTECREDASLDGYCYPHRGQRFWGLSHVPTIEDRRLHADSGRCCGIAASTGKLCNIKIGGYTFCHWHRDQRPPELFFRDVFVYYATPSRGFELTTKSAKVKENMMAFCLIREEWAEAGRRTRKKAEEAREEARKKEAQEREKAWKAQEEARRAWQEERARAAKAERKKAEEHAERLRKEHEQRRAAEEERDARFKREEHKRKQKEEERRKKAEEQERKGRMEGMQYNEAIVVAYCRACAEFDGIRRCTDSNRASFRTIPWPVLLPRSSVTPEHVTWNSVEKFFQFVRDSRSAADYRRLLEAARKRYHPDRWAAKNIINSVSVERERKQVEDLGKTVSQIINSLYTASFL